MSVNVLEERRVSTNPRRTYWDNLIACLLLSHLGRKVHLGHRMVGDPFTPEACVRPESIERFVVLEEWPNSRMTASCYRTRRELEDGLNPASRAWRPAAVFDLETSCGLEFRETITLLE